MTPQEKAEELVSKYFKFLNYEFGDLVYSLRDKQPQQCALIAVDEYLLWSSNDNIDYWEEVKQQINNL